MWTFGRLTYFLSAVLDNLTTKIVMMSLLKKIVHEREDRLRFTGTVVIAANNDEGGERSSPVASMVVLGFGVDRARGGTGS